MATEKAAASAAAYDATVQVQNNVPALEAALANAREAQRTQSYIDQVERLKGKRDKLTGFIADTDAAIANAEAELVTERARVAALVARKES